METATFGGGCFWCTEAVFAELNGVHSVLPGYMGGALANPNYEDVCTGVTGHVEVSHIEFDPNLIAYADLLKVFFGTHDPTTLNRQGNDVGPQYRSVVFFHNDAQRTAALALIEELGAAQVFDAPIVTQVEPAQTFWPAEEYHRNYLARNPHQPYCVAVVAPKLHKFRKQFAALRRAAE